MILTRAGFTVLEADDVTAASEIARRPDVALDLVVTDMAMPSGNGLALVRQLAVERPGLQCIVMSGHDTQMLLSLVEPGLNARFIQKPFTPAEFLTSVNETLRHGADLSQSSTTRAAGPTRNSA
jgi:two-component system cell cycle sensor histidine kinase/response regulator CckA